MKKIAVFLTFLLITLYSGFSQKKLSDVKPENSETTENDIQVQEPDALFITDVVPSLFDGIWEADDRYILFQEKSELNNIIKNEVELKEDKYIWIYLKIFYGWYVDRAAEKTNRKNTKYKYDVNDTVFRDIQNIKIEFSPMVNDENCCAYEIIVSYPGYKEKTVIPVCVIDDKLFLDFAIKTKELPESAVNENTINNKLYGSWSSIGQVNGIKVSRPIVKDDLTSLYITDDSIYYIRYWKTDMPYSSDMAFFSDGKHKYEVPKHIKSSGNVYTCVTGRSVTIRNVRRQNLPLENYLVNKDVNVMAFGEPYMKKISDSCDLSDMMKIVQVSNSRKAPVPPAPFPPSDLDWHLDDIRRVELSNQLIQAVRKRQREFYEKYKLGLHY